MNNDAVRLSSFYIAIEQNLCCKGRLEKNCVHIIMWISRLGGALHFANANALRHSITVICAYLTRPTFTRLLDGSEN